MTTRRPVLFTALQLLLVALCAFYFMLNPGVFFEHSSHAFWFEPCGTLIIWRSVFSTLCEVERIALVARPKGTKCNQDIGLLHSFILNRFFHSRYVRCDVAIIFYPIKDHRQNVFVVSSLLSLCENFILSLADKLCKSTSLFCCYRFKSFYILSDSFFFQDQIASDLQLGFNIMCLQLSVCSCAKNRTTFSIRICIWLNSRNI